MTTIVTLLAAALLCLFAWRGMTSVPRPPEATAAHCTDAAIRQVEDPVARAVLSSRCARRTGTPAVAGGS